MLWDAKLKAYLAYLVLEQHAQGLYDLFEIYYAGKAAYVVVGLDDSGLAQAAFDHIRINSSLYQVVYSSNLFGFLFKYADEFLANDLALLLRLCDAF